MAKRFTATEKWIDPWFCSLSSADKLFWIYLLDNCDHAGIWQVNWPLVQFHIKDYVYNPETFNGRIDVLGSEKWFIPKFLQFQYGELNRANRAHASVLLRLVNDGVKEGAIKGLIRTLQGHKDKDKDMVKDSSGGPRGGEQHLDVFEKLWARYPRKHGKDRAERYFKNTVKTPADSADIAKALDNYLASERVKKGFVRDGSTWFHDWRPWVEYTDTAQLVESDVH